MHHHVRFKILTQFQRLSEAVWHCRQSTVLWLNRLEWIASSVSLPDIPYSCCVLRMFSDMEERRRVL